MARRSKKNVPEKLRKELLELLIGFEKKLLEESLRQQVKALIPANHTLRDLGSSLIGENEDNNDSARGRILSYFQKYPKTLLSGDELMVVGGISEYARRIRELKIEFGWSIISGRILKEMVEQEREILNELHIQSIKELTTDTYVLFNTVQDKEAAHRWNEANELRKKDLSVKEKILEYMRRNVGRPISGEELSYLAKNKKEWARRIRELRTEEGWPIATKKSGHSELPVGTYILEEDKQAEKHDRKIPDTVRVEVLERDSHSCRNCAWNYLLIKPNDPRKILELHHIIHHVNKGKNTSNNLITLCNVCHDDVHRGKIEEQVLLKLIEK